ncbi:unnamed protein product [Calicophoron daubneyi]|uniref:Fascin-like domain-containing protein n=1 Tax=Calicophoron daubneyi TaxID=300641 RepID=A0AAV2T4P2_CALDB
MAFTLSIFVLSLDILQMDSVQLGEDFIECTRLGIIHSPSGRFLTVEVFNSEINIAGTSFRRRQIWTLFMERGRPDTVYLQSNLGRFLSADKNGKVSGSATSPGLDERFVLEFSPQATGTWAFRSQAYGFYLTGSDKQVSCFSKTPVWWAVRLAVHPQVHLRHQFRDRYLRLLPDGSELRADLPYPWGSEALIWLEQVPMDGSGHGPMSAAAVARLGRVALRCENGQYLKPDGSMSGKLDDSVLFAFELRPGFPTTYVFRDSTGACLTTIGPGTTRVKPTTMTPGKEEFFLIERAALQVGVMASNNKYASVKQGVEISANQQSLDETGIFQLEYVGGKGFNSSTAIVPGLALPQSPGGDAAIELTTNGSYSSATNGMAPGIYCLVTGHWRLRSRSGKLWRMAPSSPVQSTASDGDKDSLFEILTLSDQNSGADQGRVVLRTNTPDGGQSLSARKLGAISSSDHTVSETEPPAPGDVFRLKLINRPSLAFLSMLTNGFISAGRQNTLDCSSVSFERFDLRLTQNDTYQLFARGKGGNYFLWKADSDGLIHLEPTQSIPEDDPENAPTPEPSTEFQLYFLGQYRTLIRVANSHGLCLVKAGPKGEIKYEQAADIQVNCIWEF